MHACCLTEESFVYREWTLVIWDHTGTEYQVELGYVKHDECAAAARRFSRGPLQLNTPGTLLSERPWMSARGDYQEDHKKRTDELATRAAVQYDLH